VVYPPDLGVEVGADGGAGRHVRLHDVADDLDGVGVLQRRRVVRGRLDDLIPRHVREAHELAEEALLLVPVPLGGNHIAAGLVEGVDLLGREVAGDLLQVPDDLLDEGLVLAGLEGDEVPTALLRDLDERVAGHVLNACEAVSRVVPARSDRLALPSCDSCMNSNSLLTTVLRNFQ